MCTCMYVLMYPYTHTCKHTQGNKHTNTHAHMDKEITWLYFLFDTYVHPLTNTHKHMQCQVVFLFLIISGRE